MSTASRRVIVSLGAGTERYRRGVARLKASWIAHRQDATSAGAFFAAWPKGCPTHQEIPYGFKPHLLMEAAEQGYESLLWLDSCCVIQDDLEPMWQHIETKGYYFVEDGWNTGQWTADATLKAMSMSREESFRVPHIMAGCIGLSMRHYYARIFLAEWLSHSRDGVSFRGHAPTDPPSDDGRVLGHRHDQSVASILTHRLNFRRVPAPDSFFAYEKMHEGALVLAVGIDK